MNVKDITKNSLSGITVALALVPEAVAFALVAHVEPLTGLYAAFIICLLTAICGGRPGMISGATGAVAVVIGSLVVTHGVDYLFSAVILMGRVLVDEKRTLQELSDQLSISKERVRQIENKIRERLQKVVVEELGAELPDWMMP